MNGATPLLLIYAVDMDRENFTLFFKRSISILLKDRHAEPKFLCTMEFINNGATCNTSLVNKNTFFNRLKNTYIALHKHDVSKLLLSSSGEHVSVYLLVML